MLSREVVVARARKAVGLVTTYRLGSGGRDPLAESPADPLTDACDCSGFVAWALGVDRYLPNATVPHMQGKVWFETTAVYEDAMQPNFGFAARAEWEQALPGDVLVWPDHNMRQGHIGIVSEVGPAGPSKVIHCSVGNWNDYHDAIMETSPDVFRAHAAIVAKISWVK